MRKILKSGFTIGMTSILFLGACELVPLQGGAGGGLGTSSSGGKTGTGGGTVTGGGGDAGGGGAGAGGGASDLKGSFSAAAVTGDVTSLQPMKTSYLTKNEPPAASSPGTMTVYSFADVYKKADLLNPKCGGTSTGGTVEVKCSESVFISYCREDKADALCVAPQLGEEYDLSEFKFGTTAYEGKHPLQSFMITSCASGSAKYFSMPAVPGTQTGVIRVTKVNADGSANFEFENVKLVATSGGGEMTFTGSVKDLETIVRGTCP